MDLILTSKRSISDQIKEKLIQCIQTGVYAPNEKLPSVRELALELQVNQKTIVKVYTTLEEEGYIYSLVKKGYYVAQVQTDQSQRKDSLKRELLNALDYFSETEMRNILEEAISEKGEKND